MKIKCLIGRHRPVNDLSNWQHGYYLSECADCGTPMRYYGIRWEVQRPSRTKSRQDTG
ncbi:MAG TPA: hypothetical protein VGW34_13665 [Allosphingosinicella sp.]|nr:hypothetical protein [Allosphingosinicella sp.]